MKIFYFVYFFFRMKVFYIKYNNDRNDYLNINSGKFPYVYVQLKVRNAYNENETRIVKDRTMGNYITSESFP